MRNLRRPVRPVPRHALLVLVLAASTLAAEEVRDSFESKAEIREWIEARKGFGTPEFERLEINGIRYYFALFVPTSGLAHCHLYSFRRSEGPGHLVRHARLPGGCRISIRLDAASESILYLDANGAELDRLDSP